MVLVEGIKGKVPKDRSWNKVKVMMAKVDQFLDSLVNYEKENYWSVFVDHVDTQGFVMRCSTGDVGGNHRQDYYHVYDMIVSWISFDD